MSVAYVRAPVSMPGMVRERRNAFDDLLMRLGTSREALARVGVLAPRTLRRVARGQVVQPVSLRRLADALLVPLDLVELASRASSAPIEEDAT